MYEYGHKNIVENPVLCCGSGVKYRCKDTVYERKIFSYDCDIWRKVSTEKTDYKNSGCISHEDTDFKFFSHRI